MKNLIISVTRATPNIQADIDRRIWSAGSLGRDGIPANPQLPFVLFREEPAIPFGAVQETSRCVDRVFAFYTYDARGSYLRINRLLTNLREALLTLEQQRSTSGIFCMRARWLNDSQELEDADYDANMKFLRMSFVASG